MILLIFEAPPRISDGIRMALGMANSRWVPP